jgi:HD-like signal output (HDOD) protein
VLERFSLGTTHNDIGAYLLEKWQMPEETINTSRWHHADNSQELSLYVHLVQIVDRILWRQGMGDAISGELPVTSLNALQMTEDEVLAVIEPMLETCTELDNLATQLAS